MPIVQKSGRCWEDSLMKASSSASIYKNIIVFFIKNSLTLELVISLLIVSDVEFRVLGKPIDAVSCVRSK
jgi:hypothetical protein